ncbi:MAG: DUF6531 domain-containing protein [Patulibacter minatonensis]
MPGWTLTVPGRARPFTYNGTRYSAGDTFHTENGCDGVGFANAFQAENPQSGRSNSSPNAWQTMYDACSAAGPPDAGATEAGTPSEGTGGPGDGGTNGGDGDSAAQQGAPTTPPTVTASTPPPDGGTGDASASDPANPPTSDEPVGPPPPTQELRRPDTGTVDRAQLASPTSTPTLVNDPVDLATGQYHATETDLVVPNTTLPLALVRVHRSGVPAWGPFGWNWDHNHNVYLRELADGNVAIWRMLREHVYRDTGGGVFEPPRGVFEKLERVPGPGQRWTITGAGGTVLRFERPVGWVDGERIPLVEIEDRHGNTQRLRYDDQDRVEEVRDDHDRFLRFLYDECGLLTGVEDAAARRWTYEHDEETFQLTCVRTPATPDHPHGIERWYDYPDPWSLPQLRHNVLRVTDGRGRAFLENAYDEDPASLSFARVLEQRFGDHLYQYRYTELQWLPADPVYRDDASWRCEVMNPDGGVETYTFNPLGDLLDHRYRLMADGSARVVALLYAYDEHGNQISATLPDGRTEQREYDTANPDPRFRALLLRRDQSGASGFPVPSRMVWRGRYDATYGLPVEYEDETGALTRLRYDFDETPGALTNTGRLVELRHPVATLPDGTTQPASTRFEHGDGGLVTATIDPGGARTEVVYGAAGTRDADRAVERIRDAAGLAVRERYEYDAAGYQAAVVDPLGERTEKAVDALGLVGTLTLPAIGGATAQLGFGYDSDRQVTSFRRPRGSYDDPTLAGAAVEDRVVRDVLGHPERMVLSANTAAPREVRLRTDHRGFPVRTTRPDGSRVLTTYDERGRQILEQVRGTDGTLSETRASYDRTGMLRRSVDASGAITDHEYDGYGRLRRITTPDGTVSEREWGEADRLLAETRTGADDTGVTRLLAETRYDYDERGRTIRTTVRSFDTDPTAAVDTFTEVTYDSDDRPVRLVDHRGGVTTHEYDGLGRLVRTVDAAGDETRLAYDDAGHLLEERRTETTAMGGTRTHVLRHEYDARGRRTATVQADGARHEVEYDDRDVPVREIDPLGHVTEIGYDAHAQRVRELTDAGGIAAEHRWTLDVLGRTTAYTDPTGSATTYALDGLGRCTTATSPAGITSVRTFDAAGRLATEAVSGGAAFAFDYDAAGRLVAMRPTTTPAGQQPVDEHHYAYDGLGRLVRATAGGRSVRRRFDSLGRLRREASGAAATTVDYDDLLGRAEQRWPDGAIERHRTDAAGRLIRTERLAGAALGAPGAIELEPEGFRHVGRLTFPGGGTVDRVLDERGRLTAVRAAASGGAQATRLRAAYDAADRRTLALDDGPAADHRRVAPDALGRLSSEQSGVTVPGTVPATQADHDALLAAAAGGAPSEAFTYDAADARASRTPAGGPTVPYTSGPDHRPLTAGAEAFAYHPQGTRASDATRAFTVDGLGRIVRVEDGAGVACALAYDPLGRPVELRERAGAVHLQHWFGEHVVQEDRAGTPWRQLTRHPATGHTLAVHQAAATRYPVHDPRGAVAAYVDGAGTLLEAYRFSAFGEPTVLDPGGAVLPSSALGLPPEFSGQRWLPESGLYLATHRLLDPQHGVFLSPDPMGYANSASPFVFGAQGPYDYVDPDGQFAFLAVLGIMAIGALVAGGINIVRQEIAMAENPARRAEGFSWSELGMSMGIGAVAAPLLVLAPELAIPLAGLGVASGVNEISQGNYATGAFDITTALLPFGSKNGRAAAFGRGSQIGAWRGLGPVDPWNVRTGRFGQYQANPRATLEPSPFGDDVGMGLARPGGATNGGHAGVVLVDPDGVPLLFHKNGQRMPAGSPYRIGASWALDRAPLPDFYNPDAPMPWNYETTRMPGWVNEAMSSYARGRQAGPEEFVFYTKSCGNFASDVLGAGGITGMGSPTGASGVWANFLNFQGARNAGALVWGSGFWHLPQPTTPNRKCAPGG